MWVIDRIRKMSADKNTVFVYSKKSHRDFSPFDRHAKTEKTRSRQLIRRVFFKRWTWYYFLLWVRSYGGRCCKKEKETSGRHAEFGFSVSNYCSDSMVCPTRCIAQMGTESIKSRVPTKVRWHLWCCTVFASYMSRSVWVSDTDNFYLGTRTFLPIMIETAPPDL